MAFVRVRLETAFLAFALAAGPVSSAAQSAAPAFVRAEEAFMATNVARAEVAYREDLGLGGALPRAQIHPDNLWALRGLLDCLKRRGETAEAALVRQRVDLAAARADLPVSVSCFCARG